MLLHHAHSVQTLRIAFVESDSLMKPTPSSLPAIDTVEIIDLRAMDSNRVNETMTLSSQAPRWSFAGTDAQLIASLWRDLPPGEQSRCHTPPFGFRFLASGILVAEASVCWACNNVFGIMGSQELLYEFDSSHATSQQLLAETQRLTGVSLVK